MIGQVLTQSRGLTTKGCILLIQTVVVITCDKFFGRGTVVNSIVFLILCEKCELLVLISYFQTLQILTGNMNITVEYVQLVA